MGVVIAPATVEDAHAVSVLQGELGYPIPVEATCERLARILAAPDEKVFLLRSDGAVAGLLAMHFAPSLNYPVGIARITLLVVSHWMRRRGLGRRLVDHAVAIASVAGYDVLELTSGVQRLEAHAFYRGLGFEQAALRFHRRLTVEPE